MAKKAVKIEVQEVPMGSSAPIPVIPKVAISHVHVDFGREDLNNLGKKINEIIDHLNS